MKCAYVRIEHSNYPPFKLKLRTGTKVSDVLSYLNLTEDYVIFLPYPTKTFTPEEDLYGLIATDDKLVAKLSPEAERRYATLFMQ